MEKFVHIELTNGSDCDKIRGLDVNIIEGLGDSLDTFVNSKGYVPTKGDTIYLLPGVNIPRMKLKDLALNGMIRFTVGMSLCICLLNKGQSLLCFPKNTGNDL